MAAIPGEQRMTPSEAFVETLAANGVKDGPGDTEAIRAAMKLLVEAKLPVIVAGGGVAMAGGGGELQRLGRFKAPARIHFLPELPKGPSGKVQRLKLLEVLGPGRAH